MRIFEKKQEEKEEKIESQTEKVLELKQEPMQEPTQNEATKTVGKTQIYNLVILDKSGSMSSIANGAICGFNETVGGIRAAQEQFKDTQDHYVSLMVFCNCEKRMVYDKVPVAQVKELTSNEYRPCCCTPLYDAMGLALNALLKDIKDMENATAVVTVITDGYENASREYNGNAIKALVNELKTKEGWQFAYIGANQNVKEVSSSLSIDDALEFKYDEAGMREAWERDRMGKMKTFSRLSFDYGSDAMMSMEERKMARARKNMEERYFEEEPRRFTPERITHLAANEIFVFGSNIAGRHNGGAAEFALMNFGAVIGQAEGLQGQSYAIPTVGNSEDEMQEAIVRFVQFARRHPELTFLVTPIGCGHGGYNEWEVARMFKIAGTDYCNNIVLPKAFQ